MDLLPPSDGLNQLPPGGSPALARHLIGSNLYAFLSARREILAPRPERLSPNHVRPSTVRPFRDYHVGS